jgi:hypothetical protein
VEKAGAFGVLAGSVATRRLEGDGGAEAWGAAAPWPPWKITTGTEEYVGHPRQCHGVALAVAGTSEVAGMGWRSLVLLLHGFNGDKTESNEEDKKRVVRALCYVGPTGTRVARRRRRTQGSRSPGGL